MNQKLGLVALLAGSALAYSACSQEPDYDDISQHQREQGASPETVEDCPVYVVGRVLTEGRGEAQRVPPVPVNFYVVREEKSGQPYVGMIEGIQLDPFDSGDCVELALGRIEYRGTLAYVDNALVNTGRQILQYQTLSDNTCLETCYQK